MKPPINPGDLLRVLHELDLAGEREQSALKLLNFALRRKDGGPARVLPLVTPPSGSPSPAPVPLPPEPPADGGRNEAWIVGMVRPARVDQPDWYSRVGSLPRDDMPEALPPLITSLSEGELSFPKKTLRRIVPPLPT